MKQQKKQKVFFHFDIEGVLLGDKESPIREPNLRYMNGIKTLVDSNNYDVSIDICSVALLGNPDLRRKLSAAVGGKDVLQMKNTLLVGGNYKGNRIRCPYPLSSVNVKDKYKEYENSEENNSGRHHADEIWGEFCKQQQGNKIPGAGKGLLDMLGNWINRKGLEYTGHYNNIYNKGLMSLVMMLYRKFELEEDINGSILYFVDNRQNHLDEFSPLIMEAFAGLGVTVRKIGVKSYVDSEDYSQPGTADQNKNSDYADDYIKMIGSDKDFESHIANVVYNDVLHRQKLLKRMEMKEENSTPTFFQTILSFFTKILEGGNDILQPCCLVNEDDIDEEEEKFEEVTSFAQKVTQGRNAQCPGI